MDITDRVPRQALPPVDIVRVALGRRVLDIVVASTLLLLLAPLLGLLVLLVRATSGPPVIFRQRRIRAGGGEFTLYKFRTMRESSAGPGVTGSSDSRVTGTGRLLRRLSLDELPQLWHVLRGDMTLVGPRPEVPDLARRYPPECRWVFRHRPGLTGPCQLRSHAYAAQLDGRPDPEGYYLTVLVPERVALDAQFLSHATVGNVVRVAARTVLYVLTAPWERVGRHDRGGEA
ncbi:lipopolysaccharide/colanic/teichoic acid biosynthesis glycosyltransferase [Streptomyces canus]|uniref:sugar transferase n=1 Tax=Streptomyces canus TaxID=58343 RepID=UPI0027868501|nr:sugar transferase [Streptomyces canus]MDQ0597437.1 lipopolysaccharide/colanic/teichoic acid biosynthesis glycosyltransferase [Streptomyces canus]